MPGLQDAYDEAMYLFSTGDYDGAIARLEGVLATDPEHFDAQLALGMAYYRKGDFNRAIAEGRKAERLKPQEQLVHTNLSLFFMKAGDRVAAEHHGLQARIASWRRDAQQQNVGSAAAGDPELAIAKPKLEPMKVPGKFPEMPWKKKRAGSPGGETAGSEGSRSAGE